MDSAVQRGSMPVMSFKVPESMPCGLARAGRNAIIEIRGSDDRQARVLLRVMMRAAWPTRLAQRQ